MEEKKEINEEVKEDEIVRGEEVSGTDPVNAEEPLISRMKTLRPGPARRTRRFRFCECKSNSFYNTRSQKTKKNFFIDFCLVQI